ncbi:MAG: YceD family protein [Chloroflexota bacterium]|jgi:uncharacterized metal-binding protein YceD (DUF177 family)|nr:YceD family protein [Chloroflexota bacterium]MDP6507860.1 YceD family protein [Chloroflexota bacterium]MDP6756965.1 YceD family protein [Chloroflexota bacterium]
MQELLVSMSRLYRSPSGTVLPVPVDIDPAGFELEEELGRVVGEIRLVRGDGDVLAIGALSTVHAAPCRLCLDPLEVPLEIAIEGRFLTPDKPEFNHESDLYDPDIFPLIDRAEIDLTELTRQSIITVANPDLDCGGACDRYESVLASYNSGPGEDEVDPRLASLQEMKAQLLQSGEPAPQKEDE